LSYKFSPPFEFPRNIYEEIYIRINPRNILHEIFVIILFLNSKNKYIKAFVVIKGIIIVHTIDNQILLCQNLIIQRSFDGFQINQNFNNQE
jgi:hypothetical protein